MDSIAILGPPCVSPETIVVSWTVSAPPAPIALEPLEICSSPSSSGLSELKDKCINTYVQSDF